jgi:hypothetical protein
MWRRDVDDEEPLVTFKTYYGIKNIITLAEPWGSCRQQISAKFVVISSDCRV